MKAARLRLEFDSRELARDLALLTPSDWEPHFNKPYYSGDWSGAALRSVDGTPNRLYPDPTARGRYADTPLRHRLPRISAALDAFRCELLAARLLRLGPGSRIREHRDYNLSLADGEARVHVPVLTSPGVRFTLDGEVVAMGPGEAWYLDLNLPHRVENPGPEDRVHLVVDCVVDDWLLSRLPPDVGAAPPSGPAGFPERTGTVG